MVNGEKGYRLKTELRETADVFTFPANAESLYRRILNRSSKAACWLTLNDVATSETA